MIGWNINGNSLGGYHPVNVTSSSEPFPGGGVLNLLTIQALPAYNNTNVSCIATSFGSQSPVERTPIVTLVIQGKLSHMNLVRYML